ncbi:hypothetical protein VPH35_101308 [Triticum aestivum]|nr:uncharacterized protein LOC123126084 [Triticum aestivum]
MSGSGSSLPPGCLLHRRVRTDFDDNDQEDLIALQPFKILRCVKKAASGFSPQLQSHADEVVQSMDIGVHLANEPPGISCLGLRGGSPLTNIEAVDKGVVVITTTFLHDFSRMLYLVYDAVNGSLHMIPAPESPCWRFTGLTIRMLIARPRHGGDYALVLAGKLADDAGGGEEQDALLLWRPASSSLPPWSEVKKATFPNKSCVDMRVFQPDVVFSFDGIGYWVDLLRGVTYCLLDTLFNNDGDDDPVLEFGFFPLPPELPGADHRRSNSRVAHLEAYRTMHIVQDSIIKLVSIDGFLEHVDLKDRTVTVWRLLDPDMGWEKEYELRLETLWGLDGFRDLPKDISPMYPLLSTDDHDIVYIALGECRESRRIWKFIPKCAHYLLAINMRNNTIQASTCLADYFGSLDINHVISCDFSRYICVVGLDLYIMMTETMRQMSLTSLDPFDYDEAEATKMMKEGPRSWRETLKDEDRFPLPLPAHYYLQPSLARLAQQVLPDLV